MIDLDALIAEAKSRMKGEIHMPGRAFLSGVINALEAAGAERDAALARIAELEEELEIGKHLALGNMQLERDRALEAEARIAEAAKLHRNAGTSQGYDSRFSGGYGMLGDCCATCGSHGEYGVEWPCPTAAALDGAPEPEVEAEEEMYQAGCGSWDCRAPECGKA